jgi:hypothetical protein
VHPVAKAAQLEEIRGLSMTYNWIGSVTKRRKKSQETEWRDADRLNPIDNQKYLQNCSPPAKIRHHARADTGSTLLI